MPSSIVATTPSSKGEAGVSPSARVRTLGETSPAAHSTAMVDAPLVEPSPSGRPRICGSAPGIGAALRQAMREKGVQDLVYRSEYLAKMVARCADHDALSEQRHLASSGIPRSLDVAAQLLQAKQGGLLATAPRREPLGAFRAPVAAELGIRTHIENQKLRLDQLKDAGKIIVPGWPRTENGVQQRPCHSSSSCKPRLHDHDLAWRAINVADPSDVVDDIHRTALFSDILDLTKDMVFVSSRPIQRNAVNVAPPIIFPEDCFGADHLEASRSEYLQLKARCRHVEQLDAAWEPNLGHANLPFARLFWRHTGVEGKTKAFANDCADVSVLGRLLRADGLGVESASRGFSLIERGTVLRREVGKDPFSSRCIVLGERMVPLFPKGHYFEVKVVSVFRAATNPDSLVPTLEPGQRTEGLTIGVTSSAPASICGKLPCLHSVAHVPHSWSIAMSGLFRHSADTKDTSRKQLLWSAGVGEGDVVGLLVTALGGIIVFVNRRWELMIPDAGVEASAELYPVIEVCNRIRSVALVLAASPPF